MARLARDPEVEALIDAYRADLIAAGHFAEKEVTSPARAFLLRIGGPAGWPRLSLEEQCAVAGARESALVTWMITAGHVPVRPEFLARGYQRLDLGVASEPRHYAASPSVSAGQVCASIASAARKYSPTSQSFAKCK